jgi:23S rRNA pseudoU1915 N3-methylase RlmH
LAELDEVNKLQIFNLVALVREEIAKKVSIYQTVISEFHRLYKYLNNLQTPIAGFVSFLLSVQTVDSIKVLIQSELEIRSIDNKQEYTIKVSLETLIGGKDGLLETLRKKAKEILNIIKQTREQYRNEDFNYDNIIFSLYMALLELGGLIDISI